MNLLNFLKPYKYYIIGGAVLLTSLIINFFAIKSCSNYSDQNHKNIIALTDTIKYFNMKNGQLVANKTLLEGDLKTLKLANDSLYKVIKGMKVSDPTVVVYLRGEIDNEPQDTIWRIDTIVGKENFNIIRKFDFSNDYRSLLGYVSANDSTIGLNIEKDQVYFDYAFAVEDGKVYITSNNPYVKYNNIQGFELPKYQQKKKWSLGIGPHIGYGYDFQNKHFNPYVGIGLNIQYNLLSW